MAQDYLNLSFLDTHYYLLEYTAPAKLPAEVLPTDEITGFIEVSFGEYNRDTVDYRTLNGNGWASSAVTGYTTSDASFQALREGTTIESAEGTDTYSKILAWSNAKPNNADARIIVEVLPRGEGKYSVLGWGVLFKSLSPGTRNTDSGQTYTFTTKLFGEPLRGTAVPKDGGGFTITPLTSGIGG